MGGGNVKDELLQMVRSQKNKTQTIQSWLSHWEGSYEEFAELVKRWECEGNVLPIKSSGFNGYFPPLYEKYRVIPIISSQDYRETLNIFHLKMDLSFYMDRPKEWENDKLYIERIHTFLSEGKSELCTINERSFELFQHEKWLHEKGEELLKRTGLSWEDLGCYPTYEPFMYYQVNGLVKRILIIENKDTFDTYKRWVKKHKTNEFDVIIYGEGYKIHRSIQDLSDICGIVPDVEVSYFGDFDNEGIDIWYPLFVRYNVRPWYVAYEMLWRKYGHLQLKTPKKQRWDSEAVLAFCKTNQKWISFLQEGYYLPQEGLKLQDWEEGFCAR